MTAAAKTFEYEAHIPNADAQPGGSAYRKVGLVLRDWADAPGRISRYNQHDIEAQVWAYLEWGIVEPKNWPLDSDLPAHRILDDMPQKQISECYRKWQKATDLDVDS